MKNNLTEIVFILDRSGSMSGLESDTIGGFNSMIAKQKKKNEGGSTFVTTVLFNNKYQIIHDRIQITDIPPMTKEDYFASGCTALLDTVGDMITHVKSIHKYARTEDIPEKTIFIITTDGLENASKHYEIKEVKQLIQSCREEDNWDFIFLGTNIDAIETASSIGISPKYAATYSNDSEGIECNFEAIGSVLSCARQGQSINENWKKDIENNHNKQRIKKVKKR